MTRPTDIDRNVTPASRRRFLREGGALLGGAVIAGGLAGSEARAANKNPERDVHHRAPDDASVIGAIETRAATQCVLIQARASRWARAISSSDI